MQDVSRGSHLLHRLKHGIVLRHFTCKRPNSCSPYLEVPFPDLEGEWMSCTSPAEALANGHSFQGLGNNLESVLRFYDSTPTVAFDSVAGPNSYKELLAYLQHGPTCFLKKGLIRSHQESLQGVHHPGKVCREARSKSSSSALWTLAALRIQRSAAAGGLESSASACT